MPTCGYCKEFKSPKVSEVLQHQSKDNCNEGKPWGEVVRLRKAGEERKADREARKLMGVYEPMSEEDKEALKKYNEDHKDEIEQRRKEKQEYERKLKESLEQSGIKMEKKDKQEGKKAIGVDSGMVVSKTTGVGANPTLPVDAGKKRVCEKCKRVFGWRGKGAKAFKEHRC